MAGSTEPDLLQDTAGRLFAHRGASGEAPENTMGAFRLAAEQGARWVEFDVTLLGDGTPVLLHDAALNRTTNGTGPISAVGAGDLAGLDAGGWFAARFAGEPVPELGGALDALAAMGLRANLEMKRHDLEPGRLAAAVADALTARPGWGAGTLIVSSFEHDELDAMKDRMPGVALAPLWQTPGPDWRDIAERLGARAIHVHHSAADPTLLRAAERAGLVVRVYTANDPAALTGLRDLGLGGVFTDYPARFLADPAWAAWARSP